MLPTLEIDFYQRRFLIINSSSAGHQFKSDRRLHPNPSHWVGLQIQVLHLNPAIAHVNAL
jgi:hypothetical protein